METVRVALLCYTKGQAHFYRYASPSMTMQGDKMVIRSIRVDDELWAKLAAIAASRNERSNLAIVEEALSMFLDRWEQENGPLLPASE